MTVLVVEDDPTNLKLARTVLELDGHVVEAARSGAELRARLAGAAVDIVLMDIRLPDEDGYTLLGVLRAAPGWAAVPVIAVTADAMVGEEQRMRQAGFQEVVVKPIDTRTLGAIVRDHGGGKGH